MKKSLHTRWQPLLIIAMSISCFFLLTVTFALADYTYGPVTIHFQKGSAEVTATGLTLIKELSEDIRGKEVKEIRIEGFSDNIQVSKKNAFVDNESLTLARAENVSRVFQAESGLPVDLFKVAGLGNSGQIAPNNTDEGQALNRRVEIRAVIEGQQFLSTSSAAPVAGVLPQIQKQEELITLSLRKVDIAEAFEMLSKKQRINIVLDKGVSGEISVNLFDVTLDDAIKTIAVTAGYEARKNDLGYIIQLEQEVVQAEAPPVMTEIRTYALQYADSEKVETVLAKHLSKNGKATALKDRSLIVIEDIAPILDKIALLLKEIDREPKQILIEAKILEITLDETESFGLNWWKIFTQSDKLLGIDADGTGTVGVKGLSAGTTGFIFNLVNDNVNITLDALNEKGKVKTLSTPKILTIENQESSVIIGDRKGYTVTTTIDQVTTTSVEFLESGVILKVTPSVDSHNRILLQIHPEVSSGSVSAGIPSQTTTEVSTSLLADNGQTIFIGGLLKKKSDFSKDGVPVLGDIPFLGRVFSSTVDIQENTETVVLITPFIVAKDNSQQLMTEEIDKVGRAALDIQKDHKDKVPSEF